MRFRKILRSSLFKPFARFGVILSHTLPFGVEDAEILLSLGESLCSGFFIPRVCLAVVLWHSLTFVVEKAKFELCFGFSCHSTLSQIGEGAVCCGLFGIGTFLPLSEISGLLAGGVICGQGMGGVCGEEEGEAEGFIHGSSPGVV